MFYCVIRKEGRKTCRCQFRQQAHTLAALICRPPSSFSIIGSILTNDGKSFFTSFTSLSRSTEKGKDSKRSDPAFVVMEFDLSQLRVITFRPHYITFLTTQASSRVHFFMVSCENNLLHGGICHIEVVKHTFICLYGYLSMLIYIYLHVYMDAPVEELRNESCWPHARTRTQDFELTLVEKIRLWSDI